MDYTKLKSFSDGGHGWLRVPKSEIQLAVLQGLKISRYSYISTKFVYLEEDCDLSAWIEFRKITQEVIRLWKHSNSNSPSSIRKYPSFTLERLNS